MRINKSLVTNQVTGAGTGSVTSVAMTVPTGLTISGSPISSSGTLAIGFASGVALPPSQTGNAGKYLTTDGTNLSWGNISGTISGTANYVPFFATSSTLGTSPLYYDGSYYMAIGTTTTGTGRFLIYNNLADTHLQVSGTTPSIRITDTPSSATYNSVFGLAISSNSFITNTVAGDLAIANASSGSILFGIGTTEAMRIFTSTGNVSINGTSTDTGDKLYVSGGIKATAQLKLTGYTSTSAYPGTAAGYLAFDSAGNILSAAANNIYNNDGILSGNRTINGDGKSLILNNTILHTGATGSQPILLNLTTSVTHNGTSGNNPIIPWNIQISSNIRGLTTNAFIALRNVISQSRLDSSDISTNTNNYFSGLQITQSHGNTAGSGIYTANFYGFDYNASVRTGTVGNIYANRAVLGVSNFSTGNNSVVTNYYGFYSSLSVGTISGGPTGTITNYYGIFLATPTIGATGTISNRWGIYAPDSAMNHYIQGNIIVGTSTINGSAILQIDSTAKGFLPPRMTNAQRTAITTPAVGLIVYCTDMVEGLYVYKSGGWTFII